MAILGGLPFVGCGDTGTVAVVKRMRSRTPLLRVAGAAIAGAVLAPATFATGFVLSRGIGPTARNLARRGRER